MIKIKVVRHMIVGALICSLYILLGAFGAHGLEGKINKNQLNTFNTGLRYMIIHGIGIILISLVYITLNKYNKWVYLLIYGGILFFSSTSTCSQLLLQLEDYVMPFRGFYLL